MSWEKTEGGRVDLHVHSWYSDGTMGPEELYRAAEEAGVTLLAVCDHDLLAGSQELMDLTGAVRCVPGVELDALEDGVNYHILGYCYAFDHEAFQSFVRADRAQLEEVSRRLIQKMELAGEAVSIAEYSAFSYERSGGGWTALHYFMAKGLASTLQEGMRYYGVYGQSYIEVSFPSIAEVCRAIHSAGGLAVLAHPGVVMPWEDAATFERKLRGLIGLGLDGIECYYPTHSDELTQVCLGVCRELGLLITCGSDCHGSFGDTRVGELDVRETELSLGRIGQS